MCEGCDPVCKGRNIPDYLHQCGRAEVQKFSCLEKAYRRVAKVQPDITQAISFDPKKNSVNRGKYSKEGANDVLINTLTGERYTNQFVVEFRVRVLHKKEWTIDDCADKFETRIQHAPLECNYAHCNLIVLKNGTQLEKVKPSGLKSKIREFMISKLQVSVPANLAGRTLKLVVSPQQTIEDIDVTDAPASRHNKAIAAIKSFFLK